MPLYISRHYDVQYSFGIVIKYTTFSYIYLSRQNLDISTSTLLNQQLEFPSLFIYSIMLGKMYCVCNCTNIHSTFLNL